MTKTNFIFFALTIGLILLFGSCSTSDIDEISRGNDAVGQISSSQTLGDADNREDMPVCGGCGFAPGEPQYPIPPHMMHLAVSCKYCGKLYIPEQEEDPQPEPEPEPDEEVEP